jgi:hypothetical protein
VTDGNRKSFLASARVVSLSFLLLPITVYLESPDLVYQCPTGLSF